MNVKRLNFCFLKMRILGLDRTGTVSLKKSVDLPLPTTTYHSAFYQGGERRHFSFPVKSHVDFESDVVFRSDVGPESTYYLQNKAVEAEFAIVDHFEVRSKICRYDFMDLKNN